MSIFDPSRCQFDHRPTSEEIWPVVCEEIWPVVCAISNHSSRTPHDPLLWRGLSQEERTHLIRQWRGHYLNCAANDTLYVPALMGSLILMVL